MDGKLRMIALEWSISGHLCHPIRV